MTQHRVTDALVHALVTRTHAEGIVDLNVVAAIEHNGQALLIAIDDDERDAHLELPVAAVLPGEHVLDALSRCLAPLGLRVAEVTRYLGHHDRDHTHGLAREFCFAVTVTDPHAICRVPTVSHQWADLDDPGFPPSARPRLIELSTRPAQARPENQNPPLAGPLRASARGIYSDEAGVELLIGHGVWLHRHDFTERFVHIATPDAQIAVIDWAAAVTALDASTLPCSSSEAQMLRLAASLAHGTPANLRDAITGLDNRNAHLVSQAVLHASGLRPATSSQ